MVVAENLESLDELIIAMGKHLGDKYTVHHMSGEDTLNECHNIAVTDNDIGVAAFLKVDRPFVIKSENSLSQLVEWLSDMALKSISIVAEGNPNNLLFHG